MPYAENTKVPISQTKADIEKMLGRRGAAAFGTFTDADRALVAFELEGRRIRFTLPIKPDTPPQRARSLWRALMLVIKAKIESVEAGIETVEEAFLAQVMTADGRTVHEVVAPNLALSYDGSHHISFLSPPRPPA